MQARRQGGAGGKGKSKGRVVHLYSAFSILICSKALYPQRTGSMHIYVLYIRTKRSVYAGAHAPFVKSSQNNNL